jgi:polygalacturonase
VLLLVESADAGQPTKSTLVTYPAPTGIPASPDYSVEVNGQPLFVYNVKVQINRHHPLTYMGFTSFDFTKPVTVKVTANTSMEHVVIRPKARNIKPVINGNSITFKLTNPCKITIEPNGTDYNPLAIFAGTPEKEVANQLDPDVLYFGPGAHDAGVIELKDNETVYLAGGAYVKGRFHGKNVSNVRIMGRGILDRYTDDKNRSNFIGLENCKNVTIDGITLINGAGWSVVPRMCQDLTIHDIKLITTGGNSDGIDLCSCQHVKIDDVFIRNWDDCIVLKAFKDQGDTRDVTVTNSVVWVDLAQGLEIGYELLCDKICDVLWQNIDIIHTYHNSAIAIHNSGFATVENIKYDDIRIEDVDPTFDHPDLSKTIRLFDFWICKSTWTKEYGGQGKIRNITFNNINVTTVGDVLPETRVTGFDAEHNIDGITFKNLRINNKVILDEKAANFLPAQNAVNIQFLKK